MVFKFNTCTFPVYFRRIRLQKRGGAKREEEFHLNDSVQEKQEEFVPSKPINMTELEQYCEQRRAKGDFRFGAEHNVSTYTASSFFYFSNCQ